MSKTPTRMKLTFDVPKEIETGELLEAIAERIGAWDESGTVADGEGELLQWEMRQIGGGIEIDRRQRLAASALLIAFDLPQEMMSASLSMIEAAEICPGLTTGEMAPMGEQGRRKALEMAKGLIEEMLSEM